MGPKPFTNIDRMADNFYHLIICVWEIFMIFSCQEPPGPRGARHHLHPHQLHPAQAAELSRVRNRKQKQPGLELLSQPGRGAPARGQPQLGEPLIGGARSRDQDPGLSLVKQWTLKSDLRGSYYNYGEK